MTIKYGKEKDIKYGREIIGSYAESGGFTCPYCGFRNFPRESPTNCVGCGNEFSVPTYYKKELKWNK